MPRYRYQPSPTWTAGHPTTERGGGSIMEPGRDYEVPEAWATLLNLRVPGDGGPCLVPAPKKKPKKPKTSNR